MEGTPCARVVRPSSVLAPAHSRSSLPLLHTWRVRCFAMLCVRRPVWGVGDVAVPCAVAGGNHRVRPAVRAAGHAGLQRDRRVAVVDGGHPGVAAGTSTRLHRPPPPHTHTLPLVVPHQGNSQRTGVGACSCGTGARGDGSRTRHSPRKPDVCGWLRLPPLPMPPQVLGYPASQSGASTGYIPPAQVRDGGYSASPPSRKAAFEQGPPPPPNASSAGVGCQLRGRGCTLLVVDRGGVHCGGVCVCVTVMVCASLFPAGVIRGLSAELCSRGVFVIVLCCSVA
jgi:hypothetical protein